MIDTPGRLLRLLSLLQSPREWPGSELAERLGVSARTIRRDVDRLRELGYPVEASLGVTGGYRLGAGSAMPPLLLDDEEAVAIAVGLRTAAGLAVTGIEEASVRALTKLEQVLPARLRYRVGTIGGATEPLVLPPALSGHTPVPVDPAQLTLLGAAIANRERIRFEYAGAPVRRRVDPFRLVAEGRRWYLVGFDLDRADWRTFRVDRMAELEATGARVTPREFPAADAATYVRESLFTSAPTYAAVVTLHVPADEAARRLGAAATEVTPIDETSCRVRLAGDTPLWTVLRLIMLDVDFEVHEPPELVDQVRRLITRLKRS
ncbi:helix-turn-helix transcriptional regulator [Pseudonocardia sp. CA-107938]|uniref:helix-turn-helix transcriptional regulator n=1 Tax=Pseudonocardia sp. CA-107938 TaxID=3240021 RepID=UPI003D93DA02